jgi:hypothetical protein
MDPAALLNEIQHGPRAADLATLVAAGRDNAVADLLNTVREDVSVTLPVTRADAKGYLIQVGRYRRLAQPLAGELSFLQAIPAPDPLPEPWIPPYDLIVVASQLLLDPDFADKDLVSDRNAALWQALSQVPFGDRGDTYLRTDDVSAILALGQRFGSRAEALGGAGAAVSADDVSRALLGVPRG